MKTKVYLAKSNRANPDHTAMVRKTLSEFEVEIVEFSGGSYSHKPLLGCDMLVVVPELNDPDEDKEWIDIGKGLHEQIEAFKVKNKKCDILIVHECDEGYGTYVGTLDCLEYADEEDYVNYSTIILARNSSNPLSSIIENRCGASTSTKTSTKSRYRLLLTKKS